MRLPIRLRIAAYSSLLAALTILFFGVVLDRLAEPSAYQQQDQDLAKRARQFSGPGGAEAAQQRAETAEQRAQEQRHRAEELQHRAEAAEAELERLRARLAELEGH